MVGERLSAARDGSGARPAMSRFSFGLDADSMQGDEPASDQAWRDASTAVESAVKQLRGAIRKRAWRNRIRRYLDLGRTAWTSGHDSSE